MSIAPELDRIDTTLLDGLRAYVQCFATRLPVQRVSVVGNAPLAPDPARVDTIEGSDLVFRCNSFVVDRPGDAPTLGRKTDVVVAARATRVTPWFFEDYHRRAYLVVDAGNMRRPDPPGTPGSWPKDLASWPIPNRPLGAPLKRLLWPEQDGWGAVPTTGTMAAYVARRLFPEADLVLTGFSFLHDPDQTSWAHHWGDSCAVHPAHKLDREAALLQSWIDSGGARFHA